MFIYHCLIKKQNRSMNFLQNFKRKKKQLSLKSKVIM